MVEAGPGPSAATCGPTEVSDTPKHCIRLTMEQYTTLTELREDPLFKRVIVKAVYPSWEELMTGGTEHRSFTWLVCHLWLGSLKFALLSRSVDGALELYEKISTIFESLMSEVKISDGFFDPPLKMKLFFDHLGDGMFRLRLQSYGWEAAPFLNPASFLSMKESRRTMRSLSAKAMHVTRTSNWPMRVSLPHCSLTKRFLTYLDKDGTEAEGNHEELVQVSEGRNCMPFRHELRCTISYIAEQLEKRGEMVDWESLHVKALSVEDCRFPSSLSRISDDLEEFIQQRGNELLQSARSHD